MAYVAYDHPTMTYEQIVANNRSEGAKRAAKTRAKDKATFKLMNDYCAKFGDFPDAMWIDAKMLRTIERSLKSGVDGLADLRAEAERTRPERERQHAELVEQEMARRAAINAPLLAPITAEKEKAYTRLIKQRKLYEGACDLSWPEYFQFRDEHRYKPLTDDDLAYAAQWTSCAVHVRPMSKRKT